MRHNFRLTDYLLKLHQCLYPTVSSPPSALRISWKRWLYKSKNESSYPYVLWLPKGPPLEVFWERNIDLEVEPPSKFVLAISAQNPTTFSLMFCVSRTFIKGLYIVSVDSPCLRDLVFWTNHKIRIVTNIYLNGNRQTINLSSRWAPSWRKILTNIRLQLGNQVSPEKEITGGQTWAAGRISVLLQTSRLWLLLTR